MHLLNDIESDNAYFADVCTDSGYNKADVLHHRVHLVKDGYTYKHLTVYNIEKSLRHIKHTSPGTDNIPSWFFKNCCYEIAANYNTYSQSTCILP